MLRTSKGRFVDFAKAASSKLANREREQAVWTSDNVFTFQLSGRVSLRPRNGLRIGKVGEIRKQNQGARIDFALPFAYRTRRRIPRFETPRNPLPSCETALESARN